jgi:hypothetical protein
MICKSGNTICTSKDSSHCRDTKAKLTHHRIVNDSIRARVDTRYMLETDDGALIYIRYVSYAAHS